MNTFEFILICLSGIGIFITWLILSIAVFFIAASAPSGTNYSMLMLLIECVIFPIGTCFIWIFIFNSIKEFIYKNGNKKIEDKLKNKNISKSKRSSLKSALYIRQGQQAELDGILIVFSLVSGALSLKSMFKK